MLSAARVDIYTCDDIVCYFTKFLMCVCVKIKLFVVVVVHFLSLSFSLQIVFFNFLPPPHFFLSLLKVTVVEIIVVVVVVVFKIALFFLVAGIVDLVRFALDVSPRARRFWRDIHDDILIVIK
jgi:hypothetical protein